MTNEMYVYFVTTGKDPDVFEQYSYLKDRIYNVSFEIIIVIIAQTLLDAERMIEFYSFYNNSLSVVGKLFL